MLNGLKIKLPPLLVDNCSCHNKARSNLFIANQADGFDFYMRKRFDYSEKQVLEAYKVRRV